MRIRLRFIVGFVFLLVCCYLVLQFTLKSLEPSDAETNLIVNLRTPLIRPVTSDDYETDIDFGDKGEEGEDVVDTEDVINLKKN